MAKQNEVMKSVQTAPKPVALETLINKSVKELGRALPEHLKPERLVRIALTCVRQNPTLKECTPESFLGALFTSAQLGLEPVAGRAYILPFLNSRKKPDGSWHKVMEAQFVIGYKGLADLFYNHEKSVQLDWGIVHENDDFEYEYGTGAKIKHKPVFKDRGQVIAYYVIATLKNGGKPFMVMSKDDCMEHGRKHSKTYDKKKNEFYASSPWTTTPNSMCLKTVLIQLAKLLPLSVELQKAIAADETSRDFRAGIDDALDLKETTDWTDRDIVETELVKEKITEEELGTAIEPTEEEEPK